MPPIVLTTLNARYSHASLGLRYLLANMGELQPRTTLVEYTIEQRPLDIAAALLAYAPAVVGFGVYLWNVEETTKVVALLKQLRPDLVIVLGGPEVSHEYDRQAIVALADYVIGGPGDLGFAQLCRELLSGARPREKIIHAAHVEPDDIILPYAYYTDEDLAQRTVYVEASRGCPYKCEFCLSSLDKTVQAFGLERFLDAMDTLYERGLRRFKFVDRTFNLKTDTSARILEFFLARLDENLFLHFELVPDRLPERLQEIIRRFPAGTLQLEIGIQSFNPEVQALISRRQDDVKTVANLQWLRTQTHAHLHTDLIVGLPGEDLDSFAAGFDKLVALQPHEIQVGILKRLRGTPIARHTAARDMRYNPYPPYNVLSTGSIDFFTMQRLTRFARYWDMIANSGRFVRTLPLLLGTQPFVRFMTFSDWLHATSQQTHKIALDRLFEWVYAGITGPLGGPPEGVSEALTRDYLEAGYTGAVSFIASETLRANRSRRLRGQNTAPQRQSRHRRDHPQI